MSVSLLTCNRIKYNITQCNIFYLCIAAQKNYTAATCLRCIAKTSRNFYNKNTVIIYLRKLQANIIRRSKQVQCHVTRHVTYLVDVITWDGVVERTVEIIQQFDDLYRTTFRRQHREPDDIREVDRRACIQLWSHSTSCFQFIRDKTATRFIAFSFMIIIYKSRKSIYSTTITIIYSLTQKSTVQFGSRAVCLHATQFSDSVIWIKAPCKV